MGMGVIHTYIYNAFRRVGKARPYDGVQDIEYMIVTQTIKGSQKKKREMSAGTKWRPT